MFCRTCGAPNDDNAYKCVRCAEILQELAPKRIDNNLALAIVVTVLCCLPFGIVGIVQAAQVNAKARAGDIPAPRSARVRLRSGLCGDSASDSRYMACTGWSCSSRLFRSRPPDECGWPYDPCSVRRLRVGRVSGDSWLSRPGQQSIVPTLPLACSYRLAVPWLRVCASYSRATARTTSGRVLSEPLCRTGDACGGQRRHSGLP